MAAHTFINYKMNITYELATRPIKAKVKNCNNKMPTLTGS